MRRRCSRACRDAFPEYRVSGIDAPTTARPTYLAYVANDERFLTLLFDPVTARLLGELPERSFVRIVQDLHFDLLAGRTAASSTASVACCCSALCMTGLVIWWPGIANWRRGLAVDFRRSWKRVNWELHSAVGIWTGRADRDVGRDRRVFRVPVAVPRDGQRRLAAHDRRPGALVRSAPAAGLRARHGAT